MQIKAQCKQRVGVVLFLFFVATRIALYISGGKLVFLIYFSFLMIGASVYCFGAIGSLLVASLLAFTDTYLIYPFLREIYVGSEISITLVIQVFSYLLIAVVGGLIVEKNWMQKLKLQRTESELKVLQDIDKAIPVTLDRGKLLDKVLELAIQVIKKAEIGSILLVEPSDGTLTIEGVYGYPEHIKGTKISRGEGYTGWIAENKKPLLVEDTQYDISRGRFISKLTNFKEDIGIRSSIATPIMVSDELIGVIILHNTTQTHAFNLNDLSTLTSVANQTAVAIQNTEFYQRSQRAVTEALVVYKVGQAITSRLQMDELLSFVMDSAMQMFSANEGSIMFLDESDFLRIKVSSGLDSKIVKETRLKLGESIAGWVALNKKPVLVNDISDDPRFKKMQPRAGLCSALSVPLIAKEKVIGVLNLGSTCPAKFNQSDLRLLTTLASQVAIAIENAKLFREMEELYLDTIKSFVAAIEAKDPNTRGHSEHVTKYAVAIAGAMNTSEQEIEIIRVAALLHDIGKIGVHEDILNKPGSLTDDEYRVIQAHPFIATQIISHIPRMKEVVNIIYHHHEHYNGNGYCCGLKGSSIPIGARILAVADAFDAMTSARPYRDALSLSEAINELKRNANEQFDPKIVKVFCQLIEKNPEIFQDLLDTQELREGLTESPKVVH